MSKQGTIFEIPVRPGDIVYTPDAIAEKIVGWLNPKGKCLDPCRGDGAFYKYFPSGGEYCELREGKDFFDYAGKVDWIIGNPPYSIFEQFLEKSFLISDNVAFLVPTNKIFQRQLIMDRINKYGGIRSALIYGSGQLLDFPFGFSVGMFHFQRDWKGETKMIIGIKEILKAA